MNNKIEKVELNIVGRLQLKTINSYLNYDTKLDIYTIEGELKNNISIVKDGIARFEDLRFIGKSGRGKL